MMTVTDSKKTPSDADIEKISPFIFVKWLSNNQSTVMAANQLNLYYNIPIKNQYFTIKAMLNGKKVYIKYPKITKDESKELDIISKHFKISLEKAKDYRRFMSDVEINSLIRDYDNLK